MITYLGMTAPIALFSMITWLKNPYEGNKSEVEVKHLKLKDIIPMIILTVIVTLFFILYWIILIRQILFRVHFQSQQVFLQFI